MTDNLSLSANIKILAFLRMGKIFIVYLIKPRISKIPVPF